jgi:ribosomal protein S26
MSQNQRCSNRPRPKSIRFDRLKALLAEAAVENLRDKGLDPSAYFAVQMSLQTDFCNCFVTEDIGMEMKMSVEKAKQRAVELMYRGYH